MGGGGGGYNIGSLVIWSPALYIVNVIVLRVQVQEDSRSIRDMCFQLGETSPFAAACCCQSLLTLCDVAALIADSSKD